MDLLHKMNNRDRQLLGIICGVPFGVIGMIVSGTSAWVVNWVLDRVKNIKKC